MQVAKLLPQKKTRVRILGLGFRRDFLLHLHCCGGFTQFVFCQWKLEFHSLLPPHSFLLKERKMEEEVLERKTEVRCSLIGSRQLTVFSFASITPSSSSQKASSSSSTCFEPSCFFLSIFFISLSFCWCCRNRLVLMWIKVRTILLLLQFSALLQASSASRSSTWVPGRSTR